ncbi:MAG: hypothetical protein JWN03_4847 [Nocardia sp.]|nr:hypothetical protein [Nocardia sp.]
MNFTLSELIEMAWHTAPVAPPSVDQAHEIMRLHRECVVNHCPRKLAAFEALTDAGHLVPDSFRRY